jgi:glycosyltransferase involved in cell wall biosynthesis
MIDTEIYRPGDGEKIRDQWMQVVGGKKFILNVCRQSWQWKGNDRLIHAFSRFTQDANQDWRLVLMKWGPDVEKTKTLIQQLNIESKVVWENLCSKPLLRKRQQAADLVVDQLVMPGYGTSVLESMAADKPILMMPPDEKTQIYLPELPPFIGASQINEIYEALCRCNDDFFRQSQGTKNLKWLTMNHGYLSIHERYTRAYFQAIENC